MKFAAITAICGNREILRNPTVIHKNMDYYAFVDIVMPNANVWNQFTPYHFSNDKKYADRKNAKIYKILPELFIPGYDAYFWVDASHDVIENPHIIYNNYLINNEFAVFKHLQRNCLYEEAEILVNFQYDHTNLIAEEIQFFETLGYPKNNGLYELSAFVKKNTYKTTVASLKWWEYICKYSSRDQLSFPVVLWECNITPAILPGFCNGYNKYGQLGNNDLMPQTRVHIPSGV